MPLNRYQIAQSSYNDNCVGRIIRDSSGNPVSETSTGHDIIQTIFETGGALLQVPFAKEIFGILDNIFCGPKCRARRGTRAQGIRGVTQINRPTVF
jgi:hypothetical protein